MNKRIKKKKIKYLVNTILLYSLNTLYSKEMFLAQGYYWKEEYKKQVKIRYKKIYKNLNIKLNKILRSK